MLDVTVLELEVYCCSCGEHVSQILIDIDIFKYFN